jgi:hypothetical protein
MNVKSLFVVGVFLLVVGAMFTAAHAQSIELEVEGQTLVGGDIAIAGQIFAGSPDLLTLTNPLGYIDGSKIASGTIGSTQLANDAVSSTSIASGAVTSGKLATDAVTREKLGDNAVGTSEIENSKVTTEKLAPKAVTSAQIGDLAVTEINLGQNSVTRDKLGDNAVGTSEIENSKVTTEKLAPKAVTPDKLNETQDYTMNNIFANGKVGIGTTDIPVGGYGISLFSVRGAPGLSPLSPGIQLNTTADNYPLMGFSGSTHDEMAIRFDCYFDPNAVVQLSSDQSRAVISKYQDTLRFNYSKGTGAGEAFTWNAALQINLENGLITVPSILANSGTGAPVIVDANGVLKKATSSSIQYKKNVRDAADSDTGWIYSLRPVIYDYKDQTMGVNQCGLIAEEVLKVNPDIVGFKHEIEYGPEYLNEDGKPNQCGDRPMSFKVTDQPDSVSYDKLTVPMLSEMQKLRKRVDELEAQVAQYKNLEARLAALEAKKY